MRLIIENNYDEVSRWAANYVAARINQFLYLVILCALQACCILRGNRHFKMFIFQLIKLLFQAVIQLA